MSARPYRLEVLTSSPPPAPASEAKPPITLAELDGLDVTVLKGVGAKKAEKLRKNELNTVLDVITHYPRRYLDRTRQAKVDELELGEEATLLVRVLRTTTRKTRNGRPMVTSDVTDGTGHVSLTFFNQPWKANQLKEGTEVLVFGRLDEYRGKLQMSSPVVDPLGDRTGRIISVYPQSGKTGLTTKELANWAEEALRRCEPRTIADPVPEFLLSRFELVDRHQAMNGIHAPETMAASQTARDRLVFDELFRVQLALVLRKRHIESTAQGRSFDPSGEMLETLKASLGFELTKAQQRVVEEIRVDMARELPMHRLLQGDVGAGKTLVAVAAMLLAVESGHQAALMAPTEVLAEQHYLGVRELLSSITVADPTTLMGERELRVAVLTNRTTPTDRKRINAELADGSIDVIVGTHALIQDKVRFGSLGLAVVDEQHRFGVEQRAALRTKNEDGAVPDVLVMTATPIPRTAAMTVYGDLDVSVLDELPPGRTPIETSWVQTPFDEAEMWDTVRAEVAQGRQVYVVCPLIEESEKLEVSSAEDVFAQLQAVELPDLKLGLLHGRVPAADKELVMHQFRDGHLDVLVATTVIEVGVDVPNATVMVILDANRFGIAQLHQLRGRVGRGAAASKCFLQGEATTADGESRLEALVASTDGFELAEVDLELRGEGTIMGERQKGRNDLKLASLRRDKEWVQRARAAAIAVIGESEVEEFREEYPELAAEVEAMLGEEDAEFLMKG